ncbi:hypothetical protein HMPREF9108_01621 [Leptotrichia sp. oral taxon 225 str. F0581]|nr:hypothetical protein HMPREF9108_01621 [Leptotrichia sp. oral taxon 225 str. F0581]
MSVSEFHFYFKKMLRQARDAREMATDFPCFIKRKNIKVIEKIFINNKHFFKI